MNAAGIVLVIVIFPHRVGNAGGIQLAQGVCFCHETSPHITLIIPQNVQKRQGASFYLGIRKK
jgi:hypothetical protein